MSGQIYNRLKITRAKVSKDTDMIDLFKENGKRAVYREYEYEDENKRDKQGKVIHVVGPNPIEEVALMTAYENVFRAFETHGKFDDHTDPAKLHLCFISTGIFLGTKSTEQCALITKKAVTSALKRVWGTCPNFRAAVNDGHVNFYCTNNDLVKELLEVGFKEAELSDDSSNDYPKYSVIGQGAMGCVFGSETDREAAYKIELPGDEGNKENAIMKRLGKKAGSHHIAATKLKKEKVTEAKEEQGTHSFVLADKEFILSLIHI